MRIWSADRAASLNAAGITRGRPDAIRPGQLSDISGFCVGACTRSNAPTGIALRASAAMAGPKERTLLQVISAAQSIPAKYGTVYGHEPCAKKKRRRTQPLHNLCAVNQRDETISPLGVTTTQRPS